MSDSSTEIRASGKLSLFDFIFLIRNDLGLIIGGTFAATVVAIAVAFVMPEKFESTAVLLLQPPPVKEAQERQIGLFPKALTIQDYDILLKSDEVLTKVAKRVIESGKYEEAETDGLTRLSSLRTSFATTTKITEQSAYGTEYSPVIVLKATGPSAEMARDLAQAWADIAQEEAAGFYEKGKSGVKEFVEEQFKSVELALEGVFDQQRENETAWNEEMGNTMIMSKTTLLTSLETELAETRILAETTRKELEESQVRLDQTPEKVTLWNSPPMEAVFLENGQRSGPNSKEEGFFGEVLNPTYELLEKEVNTRSSQLKGLEQKIESTVQTVETVQQEIERIRAENATFSKEKKLLDHQAQAYGRNFDLLADKLEQAKIAESEQRSLVDIKIVANAVAPDRKVAPKRGVIAATAFLLGFALSVAGVFLRHLLELYATAPKPEAAG